MTEVTPPPLLCPVSPVSVRGPVLRSRSPRLGASDLRLCNENPQIPSGTRRTADADADHPGTSHPRTHGPSGCARVKKRVS